MELTTALIQQVATATSVPGNKGRYVVRFAEDDARCVCTCPDFQYRRYERTGPDRACKHITLVRNSLGVMRAAHQVAA